MRTTQIDGLDVSVIGLGAMHLSLDGRPEAETAVRVVHRALDLGVTLLDTADSYCTDEGDKHHNERLLRDALDRYDGDTTRVVVATKGGMMRPDGAWTRNGRPEHLRQTIRASADALGGPIQLWQHHAPDPEVPVEESLGAAREAVDEGLIRHVGVSNYSVEQIEQARAVVPVVSVQNQYSPWHRTPEQSGVLAYAEREGLTFLPWSPLGGSSRADDLDAYDVLTEIAEAHDASVQRVVVAWLMARSPVVLPIPGTTDPDHVEDLVHAAELHLSDAEVARLDRGVGA